MRSALDLVFSSIQIIQSQSIQKLEENQAWNMLFRRDVSSSPRRSDTSHQSYARRRNMTATTIPILHSSGTGTSSLRLKFYESKRSGGHYEQKVESEVWSFTHAKARENPVPARDTANVLGTWMHVQTTAGSIEEHQFSSHIWVSIE